MLNKLEHKIYWCSSVILSGFGSDLNQSEDSSLCKFQILFYMLITSKFPLLLTKFNSPRNT